MKDIFKPGDLKTFTRKVTPNDFAMFNGEVVHPVFSTYALSRDFEWTTRQFVLDMRDDDEEGIGTFVHVDHQSPAFERDEIVFEGRIEQVNSHEVICSVRARVGERIVATGKTGQKILKRDKIKKIFNRP